MNKILTTIAIWLTAMAAVAQTLNVATGSVTYQFPAAQAGEMTYDNGQTLIILNKTYSLADITKLYTDESEVKDNEVNVVYNGDAALVYVAGNIAQYITASVNGAHVSITQSDAVTNDLINDGTLSEITYNLSGTSTDGSLNLGGSAKCTVAVNGLELTNPSGAPINITNGKRVDFSVKKGSENTLKDGTESTDKGCLYCKGHLELKGKGVLNIYAYGSAAHGIKAGDYVEMKNCTVNILAATKDGISCNEYFLMESGELNISSVGDDGIQCDIDNDEGVSTGQLEDHEDEDSGNIYIEGGTINVSVTADAAKGIKGEGDMTITDGTITIKTTGGGVWDTSKLKTKASACLGSDGNMTISGGTLTLTSTGAGGKGINVDGAFTVNGGTTTIKTSGNAVVASSKGTLTVVTSSQQLDRYDSDHKSSPKGIKVDGTIVINGGTINVTTTGCGGEGIESKSTLDINDGYIYVSAADDAINSSSHMTITGGYIMANSTGNDGLDANGNMYIKGGNIFAIATSQPEVGIDANTEGGYKLYITGGNIVAIGGFEGGSSISGGTAKSASYSKGKWYALYNGSDIAFAFKVPSNNSMGSSMAVYTTDTPALKSGVTGSGNSFWNGNGNTDASGGSTVTLSDYNNNGGGPGGGGPGGGGGHPGGW